MWVTYCPLLGASTGFCKFSDKKEPVWGLLFRNCHRSGKNCNSFGPILRNIAESQMKILPQLLAILSSLQGYAANRPSGARHAAAGSGGISMSFGLRVKQETQMRQTCITLAITTLIPITASASGLTYSESRLSYQSQESNSNTARRANLNVGFEAGAALKSGCNLVLSCRLRSCAANMQSGFSRLDRRYRHSHQNVEHAAPAIPPNTSVRCARVRVTPPKLNRAFDKAFHFKTSQKFGLKAIYGCLLDFNCYL